jgi:hypothetical protein
LPACIDWTNLDQYADLRRTVSGSEVAAMDIMTMTPTAALRPQSKPRFVVSGAGCRADEAGAAWAILTGARHRVRLMTQPKSAHITGTVSFNVPQCGALPRGAPS